MLNVYGLIMFCGTIFTAFSQLLLKKSANKEHKNFISQFCNPYVIFSYLILALVMFSNIIAYSGLDYRYGPILNSFSYVFVFLFGTLLLKENVTKRKIVGVILIIIGVIISGL